MAAAPDRAVSPTRRAAAGAKRNPRRPRDSRRAPEPVRGSIDRALIEQVERLRRGQPAEALAALEGGFARALEVSPPSGRGELWRLRGHVLRSLRRAREAV